MDALDAIQQRRAVKHFDPHHQLSEEELHQLLSLAQLSPTAFNIQNWRFVVVQDKALRQEVRDVSWNQAQVTDASVLIVLCADLKAWSRQPERYWRNAPAEVQNMLVPAIQQYYAGHDQVQRDEAMRSCGMAAQTLMIAAKAMGYDSCPMDGFDFEAVAKLINLPHDHVIAMFVAIGKAIRPAHSRGGDIPFEEAVIWDHF
jgi:nitroreductase